MNQNYHILEGDEISEVTSYGYKGWLIQKKPDHFGNHASCECMCVSSEDPFWMFMEPLGSAIKEVAAGCNGITPQRFWNPMCKMRSSLGKCRLQWESIWKQDFVLNPGILDPGGAYG